MNTDPIARYAALVAEGAVVHDPAQEALAERLSRLADALAKARPIPGSLLDRILARLQRRRPPRGVYVHGEVGRGKTMLVDMFFETAPARRKRRAHFNDFMADVHDRIHAVRRAASGTGSAGDDAIPAVARDIAGQAQLVCLDEFHVDDVADAMILGRLFTVMFKEGVVLVATSNQPPDQLYAHGLNRALFLPFIALLKERTEVFNLDAATDYRLMKLRDAGVWFAPCDANADAAMDAAWNRLTDGGGGEEMALNLKGRELTVPRASLGAARFHFDQLCRAPLGPNDFLAIARRFHTVVIDQIPVIGPRERNAARRFVLLVDTLYDHRVKIVASAAGEPDVLYPDGPLSDEFRRTASRLIEMRSEDYLASAHGARSTRIAASSP